MSKEKNVNNASYSVVEDAQKVKKTIGFVGDFVSNLADLIAPVLGLFGSKYTAPVVAISTVSKSLGSLNDKDSCEILEKNIIGFDGLLSAMQNKIIEAESSNVAHISLEDFKTLYNEFSSMNELRKVQNKILD